MRTTSEERRARLALVTPEGIETLVTVTNVLDRANREALKVMREDPMGGLDLIELSAGLDRAWGTAQALVLAQGVEDFGPDGGARSTGEDPRALLRRAEALTREHPSYAFPPGITDLVIQLLDLLREHCRE